MIPENKISGKVRNIGIYSILAVLIVFLQYHKQRDLGYENWKSVLWSDQAGYYVYLPALFIYGMDAEKMPDGIQEKYGQGFHIENNKIGTKYSYGVAFLQAPVFFVIHALSKPLGFQNSGFSPIYTWVPNLSLIICFLFGIYFLHRFLRYYFPEKISILTILFFVLGSNMTYYILESPGMSHVYSFALFNVYLYYLKNWIVSDYSSRKSLIFIFILLAFITVIRPINAIMILFLMFFEIKSREDLRNRFQNLLKVKNILIGITIFFIVWLPQMLYWKYLSGSYVFYSYTQEGFSNKFDPKILEVWFSPNAGLFTYSPVMLFVVFSMIWFWKKRTVWLSIFMFIAITYLTASWHQPYFGCSFGSRNFTDYSGVFALPAGLLMNAVFRSKIMIRVITILFIIASILLCQKLFLTFNKCYSGDYWEWKEYKRMVTHLPYQEKSKFTGLENKSLQFNSSVTLSPNFEIILSDLSNTGFRNVVIKMDVKTNENIDDIYLVSSLMEKDSMISYKAFDIADFLNKKDNWQKIRIPFHLPLHSNTDSRIVYYIWNKGRGNFQIDNLYIRLF